jgi:DNA-binding MarR family transcriptional regulator
MPPPQVGALLRMAWESLHSELVDGLVSAGFTDLRPPHRPLLRYVLTDGLRPGALAARLGISKQAVNDLLREFEANGYLVLEPDPADRRAKRIRLTERGWDLAITASNLSHAVAGRWAAHVGAERYAQFESVLRDIVEHESRAASRDKTALP